MLRVDIPGISSVSTCLFLRLLSKPMVMFQNCLYSLSKTPLTSKRQSPPCKVVTENKSGKEMHLRYDCSSSKGWILVTSYKCKIQLNYSIDFLNKTIKSQFE
jgi:hypothetical protein